MGTEIVLSLPDKVYQQATRLAELMNQDVPSVLADTIENTLSPLGSSAIDLTPVAQLSDKELLAVTELQMDDAQGQRLGNLLEQQQAEDLSAAERSELAGLMQVYNECLVRKAQALAEAVRRGLREPLTSW